MLVGRVCAVRYSSWILLQKFLYIYSNRMFRTSAMQIKRFRCVDSGVLNEECSTKRRPSGATENVSSMFCLAFDLSLQELSFSPQQTNWFIYAVVVVHIYQIWFIQITHNPFEDPSLQRSAAEPDSPVSRWALERFLMVWTDGKCNVNLWRLLPCFLCVSPSAFFFSSSFFPPPAGCKSSFSRKP